jgi:hypothetical protein
MSINNCADDLPAYDTNNCDVDLLPGASKFVFIDQDNTFTNLSSAAQWVAEQAANNAFISGKGKGSYPTPTPDEKTNPRADGPDNKIMKMNHVFTFEDPNVNNTNDDYYAALNGRIGYLAWYNFEQDEVRANLTDLCVFKAMPANDDLSADFQKYMITVEWKSSPNGTPVRRPAPVGVFS